jgi:predicted membrane protein
MTRRNKYRSDNRHLIGGIVVLIVGVLFLLRNFDVLSPEISHYIFSWKTLLIGIGILNISLTERKVGGFILIAVGTFFWLPDILDVSIRTSQLFWPVVLVIAGLMMLFKKPGHHPRRPWRSGTPPFGGHDPEQDPSKNTNNEDYVDEVTIFSGTSKINNSKNFKGGKMTAIFGGSELNLTHARLAPGTHVLDVFFMFGGSEIIVPSDWHIQLETTPIFGGVSDKRYISEKMYSEEKPESVLIIRGTVIFGGAEIKSY